MPKPTTTEPYSVRIYPRFTEKLAAKVKAEAKKSGLGEGEMIREIVTQYFNNKKAK